ncbi:hypothetical protein NPIL_57961, partial [Nephila pilipes]
NLRVHLGIILSKEFSIEVILNKFSAIKSVCCSSYYNRKGF